MKTDQQRTRNARAYGRSRRRERRAAAKLSGTNAYEISARLLWLPIGVHLLAGSSLLAFPALWRSYFFKLAETYPEVSQGVSRSMLAAGLLQLLLAGILLFVLSAYRQKARWAWWVFMVAFTLGWGGGFVVQLKAGVAWAAILSAVVVLLGWVALGLGSGEVFGPARGRVDSESLGEEPGLTIGMTDGE